MFYLTTHSTHFIYGYMASDKGGAACTGGYKGVRAVRPESVTGGGCHTYWEWLCFIQVCGSGSGTWRITKTLNQWAKQKTSRVEAMCPLPFQPPRPPPPPAPWPCLVMREIELENILTPSNSDMLINILY